MSIYIYTNSCDLNINEGIINYYYIYIFFDVLNTNMIVIIAPYTTCISQTNNFLPFAIYIDTRYVLIYLNRSIDLTIEPKARDISNCSCDQKEGEGNNGHISIIQNDWQKTMHFQFCQMIPNRV